MSFLMIENKINSIPSVEAIRMLGVSFSRGNENRIGQFGSGFPASLALLARHGLLESLKLCLGKDVYTFSTVYHKMKDSSGWETFKQEIRMRKQGGGSWDLNISTEFGELDWHDVTMAVREFLSNALDGAESYDSGYKSVVVDPTIPDEGRNCRAKDGCIRVYLKINDEIMEYVNNINNKFICMTPGYDKNKRLYKNFDHGPARVYRRGVMVGEFGENTSLFHYNFPDIDLKESRIVDTTEAENRCAREIGLGSLDTVCMFLRAMKDPENSKRYWEHEFSTYRMNPDHMWDISYAERDKAKATWKEAIEIVFGETVVVESQTVAAMVASKGIAVYQPESSAFGGMLKALGAKSSDKVLSRHEIDGKTLQSPSEDMITSLNTAWRLIEQAGATNGKPKPSIMGFSSNDVFDKNNMSYFINGESTIYVREVEFTHLTFRAVVKECARYITGASDNSDELQRFAFTLASWAMLKL